MQVHSRHAGDVGRPIIVTFPSAINLTGAAVRIQVQDRQGTSLLDEEMTVTSTSDPATAEYAPLAGELDELGAHYWTAEVTYSGGAIESFPTPGFARMLVERQMDLVT